MAMQDDDTQRQRLSPDRANEVDLRLVLQHEWNILEYPPDLSFRNTGQGLTRIRISVTGGRRIAGHVLGDTLFPKKDRKCIHGEVVGRLQSSRPENNLRHGR